MKKQKSIWKFLQVAVKRMLRGRRAFPVKKRLQEVPVDEAINIETIFEDQLAWQQEQTQIQEERWEGALKAARLHTDQIIPQVEKILPLDRNERLILPQKQNQFLNTLLIRNQKDPFISVVKWCDTVAVSKYCALKMPSLVDWVEEAYALNENSLMLDPSEQVVQIDWIRDAFLETQKQAEIHEVLMAQYISVANLTGAQAELKKAGIDRLQIEQAERILGAIGQKKEEGKIEGLDEAHLEVLLQTLGGIEGLQELLRGLSGGQLQGAVFELIRALKNSRSAEMALLAISQKINSVKAKERFEQALLACSVSNDRATLLSKVLTGSKDVGSAQKSVASAAIALRVEGNIVGKIVWNNDKLSPQQISYLSGATSAAEVLASNGAPALAQVQRQELQTMFQARLSQAGNPLVKAVKLNSATVLPQSSSLSDKSIRPNTKIEEKLSASRPSASAPSGPKGP